MTATRPRWQVTTELSKDLGQYTIRICHLEVAQAEVSPSLELEQEVGDFIARHVLEKDSVFFGG